jgi:hypothetical protein
LDDSDKAKAEEKAASGSARITTRENKDNILFESRDERRKEVIHRSYVKKH